MIKKLNSSSLLVTILIASVMVFTLLPGCLSTAPKTDDAASENRAYMSQVSQLMDTLSTDLGDFGQAVSDNDIVGMKTMSDNAKKTIDKLIKITPPETMAEIHDEYVSGCNDLIKALNDYIALYTEIDTATDVQPFDYETYDDRIEKIQDTYDSGIEHLEKADKKATELE